MELWKNKIYWGLTAIAVVSHMIAFVITWYGLTYHNGTEQNPVMDAMFSSYGYLFPGIISTVGIFYVCVGVICAFDIIGEIAFANATPPVIKQKTIKVFTWVTYSLLGAIAAFNSIDMVNDILMIIKHPFAVYTYGILCFLSSDISVSILSICS